MYIILSFSLELYNIVKFLTFQVMLYVDMEVNGVPIKVLLRFNKERSTPVAFVSLL